MYCVLLGSMVMRCCMKSEAPMMAQLTAIRGKKIPSEAYSEGLKRSTTISTNCTIPAITAMKRIKAKKLRSTPSTKQLGPSTLVCNKKFTGRVMSNTKVTATPRPRAVFTFFDTAR